MKGFLLFLCVIALSITSCCPPYGGYQPKYPLTNGTTCTPVPSLEETEPGSTQTTGPTNFVVINLGQPKVQDEVTTYDFNLRTANGFTVYGLGAIDNGRLIILLKSQTQIIQITWEDAEGGTQNFSPENGPPQDLEMKIDDAPGSNFWFSLPIAAVNVGQLKVFYDDSAK